MINSINYLYLETKIYHLSSLSLENSFNKIKMGSSPSKETLEYSNFMKEIKEVVKSKSMYQYQIAHFKILDIEKKIVPTAEYIQIVKINKIMTSKRLTDLKKTLSRVKTESNEITDLAKLKSLEMNLEEKLKKVNLAFKELHDEESQVKCKSKYLENLENTRKSLFHKSQYLEMKVMKVDYNRRFSIQNVKNIKPLGVGSAKKRSFSQFIINQRLENCEKCLDRLEKMSAHAVKYNIDSYKNKICELEQRVSELKEEKERIREINKVDLIELKNSINLEKILEDVNRIRSEIQVLRTENSAKKK